MPTASVNGIALYYEETGRGRPLVWSHGFSCGLRMWAPQVAALAAHYRVIAYDARGHGASEAPAAAEAYSQPLSVEDLRGLLRHCGIARAVVGGLSMGGNIALNFALAHPEMVDGLIICDTGAGSDGTAEWVAQCEAWAQLLEREGIEAFADAIMAHPLLARYVAQGPTAARHMRSLVTTHRARGLAHTLRGVLARRPTMYSLEPKLRQLPVPALLIVGEFDEPCVKVHRFMADAIPGAAPVLIKGVGHMTNLEDPATFNGLVAQFLRRIHCA
ncbi:MAG: alpha/beta fold hydrolase [Candidatus Rokubacteria bacterium]|nr:alpha/beta fold hydrolase [Candidatus Rokubacteria bacterium]